MKTSAVFLTVLLLTLSSPAFAEEQMQYNIVNLSAQQSRQVANDIMAVTLQAVVQKDRAAEAGQAVNEVMNWAEQIISANAEIKHRTINYQTQPVYQNRSLTGWKVSQQLLLQSSDIDALTAMVGTLQQQLQVISMRFEISPDRREQEVDGLIVEALQAFRTKAELITSTLKAQDYHLVNISVRENGGFVPYRGVVQAEAMAMAAAPPSVEAGDSEVRVSVDGTIQLIF